VDSRSKEHIHRPDRTLPLETIPEVDKPKKEGQPQGLLNQGNTCFLNSTLQCLKAITKSRELRQTNTKTHSTTNRLLKCVGELEKTDKTYIPFPLLQVIHTLMQHVKGTEADAHEFLIAVINDGF